MLLASLSPRRKAFVGGLALLAVVAGSTAAALALLSRAGAAPSAAYPAQNRPGPVILVPGYGGSTRALSVLASRIRVTGRAAIVVPLPGNGTGSLIADAAPSMPQSPGRWAPGHRRSMWSATRPAALPPCCGPVMTAEIARHGG